MPKIDEHAEDDLLQTDHGKSLYGSIMAAVVAGPVGFGRGNLGHALAEDLDVGGGAISTTEGKARLVAIVDDDESVRRALVGLMKASGFLALPLASAEEFLDSGQLHQTACLVADIRMPGMSGLELQAKLNAEHPSIPTIFITVDGDEKTRKQALSAGAVELLTKPLEDEVLLACVRAALER